MSRHAFPARHVRYWPACGIAFLLAGCATVAEMTDDAATWMRAYVEPPASQPHALMRASVAGQLRLIPGSACMNFKTPGAGAVISSTISLLNDTSHHDRKQGMRGQAPTGYQSAELRLYAGVPSTLVYGSVWRDGAGHVRSCQVARSFVPVAGQQYQMTSVVDAATGCGVELRMLDSGELVDTQAAPLMCESVAAR